MRILVCASEAPLAPLNGFRLQLRPVCEELARDHDVVVLAYRWPGQDGGQPTGVELRCLPLPQPPAVRRAATWLSARDPLAAVSEGAPMARAMHEALAAGDFDVVHVAGWPLAGLGRELGDVPRVLTTLDAWYLNYRTKSRRASGVRRPMYRLEAERIRRWERATYRGFSSVVVVTEQDAVALRALDPAIPAEVVPNGVDADHYAPRPDALADDGLVVFTGAMQWAPNVDAARFLARDVLPLLRRDVPAARVALVGRTPAPAVSELAELAGVHVTGDVPDIRDWLVRAQVFACPMVSGTGIKNKLLEAMACGLACVVTPLACQGLDVRDGEHLVIADGAGAMSDGIARLLADGALRARIGAAARGYVVQHHSWRAVGGTYESLLLAAIGTTGVPGAASS